MNNADLYDFAISLQRRDAEIILSENLDLMTWKPGDRVLDIGCGSGFVTTKVLLPRLPEDIEEIIGGDLSHNMIQYASNTYKHPKLKFSHLDIGAENIKDDLYTPGFDKIFSFFCIHFIDDQRRVFSNIARLLRPRGEALLLIIAKTRLIDVYINQTENSKWKKYLKNAVTYKFPYNFLSDPEGDLKKFVNGTGLSILKFESKEMTYKFHSRNQMNDFFESINPFLDFIPTEQHVEYIEDTVTQTLMDGSYNSDEKSCLFGYKIYVVYLHKI